MTQLFLSTRKGLFVFDRHGAGWRIAGRHFLGEPVTATLADAGGKRILSALRLGHFGVKLRLSEDAGATWNEVTAPAYPPKPEPKHGESEDPHPWQLDQVWVLEGFHPKTPNRVWAGTNPGGLFRSNDGGRSWTLIESLWTMPGRKQWFGGGYDIPGIHSICVHPNDPDDIVVGVSCGGAWRTRNGGKTWTAGRGMRADFMPPERADDPVIQDPHRIVQCESAPAVLWTQHHCGIWKSVDRGATWHEITTARPTNFGFAVAVHPHDPDTAWFAPAIKDERRYPLNGEFVASRTQDGGKSFEVLRDGLPRDESYDLVYRHGLAISADGNLLAMGSTTGGVWWSEDGGAKWRAFEERMAPVYAVAVR
jgi:photosystem II stability/assembly factor-like uncharacterized protein